MAVVKLVGLVLLVVVPGGSLVLLAIAGVRAYRQRTGALDFQHHLADEQPMLAPMLTVVIDHGLNKLQVGPYPTREDARTAADRLRVSLHLVPTLVEKH